MNITIITASHRKTSQSRKVGNFIQSQIKANNLFQNSEILDLSQIEIPFWDEDVWNDTEQWRNILNPIELKLESSDAFVIISPEWSGMVPAKLKNFFLLFSSKQLGHKPALIVTVSSGLGGSYPVNELRSSSYKNTKICYIPDHVIVRDVENTLNDDQDLNNKYDKDLRDRIMYSLEILEKYSQALKIVRQSNINFNKYPFGM